MERLGVQSGVRERYYGRGEGCRRRMALEGESAPTGERNGHRIDRGFTPAEFTPAEQHPGPRVRTTRRRLCRNLLGRGGRFSRSSWLAPLPAIQPQDHGLTDRQWPRDDTFPTAPSRGDDEMVGERHSPRMSAWSLDLEFSKSGSLERWVSETSEVVWFPYLTLTGRPTSKAHVQLAGRRSQPYGVQYLYMYLTRREGGGFQVSMTPHVPRHHLHVA